MFKPLFSGTCTALVTPFLHNRINYPILQQLIAQQFGSGVSAVVLSGTTGEAPTLSDAEKIELFAKGKEYAGNEHMIIAGTGSNNTQHAIQLSKAAESVGADALLVVTPYYNKGNLQGIYDHFSAIADAVSIPIILYNVPGRTGVDIPVDLYQKLSKIQNIVGVKEASADITKIAKIRNKCSDDFCVWSGNDDAVIPAMSVGAMGVISVLSNIYPEETALMTNSALAGDYHTAGVLQCRMMPMIEALFSEVNPIPVKYAMKLIGYDCGPCRLPLGEPSEKTKNTITSLL